MLCQWREAPSILNVYGHGTASKNCCVLENDGTISFDMSGTHNWVTQHHILEDLNLMFYCTWQRPSLIC